MTAENIKTYRLEQIPEWLPAELKKRLADEGRLVLRGRFSGAEKLVLKKRRWMAPSKWMPKHRVMTTGPLAGSKWDNDLTPYVPGIMDASFFPGVETIILCATPQTAKSETVNNCLAFLADLAPGPAMVTYPDRDTARENSQDRLQLMFERSSRLRGYMTGSDEDMTNIRIRLRHMPIYLAWARSASRLANKPIRYLVLDEIDKYPAELTGEADPISLAEKRTITYQWNRRIWKISTPTIETGAIWLALTTEAQAVFDYHARCPGCGALRKMVFSSEDGTHRICWPPDERDPETVERDKLAWYECEHCGEHWTDRMRDLAVRMGQWIERGSGLELFAHLKKHRPSKIGFHLPAWNSPFISLSTCAAAFLRAQKGRPNYIAKLKDFKNAICAEPWKLTTAARKEAAILALRDDRPRGKVPGGNQVACLLAGVDTQDDGFWYRIRAFGFGGPELLMESWGIREGFVTEFGALERVLWQDEYFDPDGNRYPIFMTIQDALGHRTSEVYNFCLKHRGKIFPSFGRQKLAQAFTRTTLEYYPGKKKPLPFGLEAFNVNTNFFKDQLTGLLEISPGDPGAWHENAEFSEAWAKHMTAEYIDEKGLWVCPSSAANHLWDCAVLCLCAHEFLQIKFRSAPAAESESGGGSQTGRVGRSVRSAGVKKT